MGKSNNYEKYIQQDWIRAQIQVYELLRRLRDDHHFRGIWVENEITARTKADADGAMSETEMRDLLLAYLNEFDFRILRNNTGKPVVHISPKRFRGLPYSAILGISSKNLSTCLNLLVESAVNDVIKGYGKGAVLSGIFGEDYGKLFNAYVVGRMKEEFGQ